MLIQFQDIWPQSIQGFVEQHFEGCFSSFFFFSPFTGHLEPQNVSYLTKIYFRVQTVSRTVLL